MTRERTYLMLIVGVLIGVVVGAVGSLVLKVVGFSGNAEPWLLPISVGVSTGILAGLLPRRPGK